MKSRTIVAIAVVAALGMVPAISIAGPANIYVSFADIGDGGAAGNTAASFDVGTSGSAYIWVDENFSIDTGAFLDVLNNNEGVLAFTGAEVFNPDILLVGNPFDVRWQSVGVGGAISAGLIDELNGFSVNIGTGIDPSQVTGAPLADAFHDDSSNGFLFARIDFDVIGEGTAGISLETGFGLVVDAGAELSPAYGGATVTGVGVAIPEPTSAAIIALGLVGLVSRRRR